MTNKKNIRFIKMEDFLRQLKQNEQQQPPRVIKKDPEWLVQMRKEMDEINAEDDRQKEEGFQRFYGRLLKCIENIKPGDLK